MSDPCTWQASLGQESWPCTGDHSAGVHHFAGTDWTLPLAVTLTAGRDRATRPRRPSGGGLDVADVLAARGLPAAGPAGWHEQHHRYPEETT